MSRMIASLTAIATLAACDVFNPDAGLPLEGEALRQAQARTRNECGLWLEAVEGFRRDYGRYPSGREGLRFLVLYPDPKEHPEWGGPYGAVDKTFLDDPWGHAYQFRANATEIAVVSAGRDRRFDTGDDIRVTQAVDYYSE